MKNNKHVKIALIGMMGTGKTATGPLLAEKLGIAFADLDDMIVARMGMSIAQTFITYGERIFRQYETSILSEVVWHEDIVISCGGGVPLNEENMAMMDDYVKVLLCADVDTIYQRTKDDVMRPLIKDNSPVAIERILNERKETYQKYADFTVNTQNKPISDVVDEIISLLSNANII